MGNVLQNTGGNTLKIHGGGVFGSAAAAVASWQLPTANYVSSKLTMAANAPRPDGERTTNSRYSFMHSGMENAMPIIVLGGAYPYHYEITARSGTADTSTATIGETRTYDTDRSWYGSTNQKDYGVFRWTPTGDDGSTYNFTVTVTGQDGVSIAVPFSGVVQDSKFIFVDPNNGNDTTGTGTLAAPWATNLKWYIDATNATYADKFVVWRAGLQTQMGGGRLAGTYKPHVYIAFEGDAQPTYDGTLQDHHFSTASPDFFWGGIRINGTKSDYANVRYFEIFSGSALHRAVFWNNYFYNASGGTVGTDNEAWIMSWSDGSDPKEYLSVVGNTFDTLPLSANTNGFDTVRLYDVNKYVFEHNIIKNSDADTLHQPKDSCFNVSIRANDMWEGNTSTYGILLSNQNGGNTHEVCWNWIYTRNPVVENLANTSVDIVDFFMYRNTASDGAGENRTPLDLFGGNSQPFGGLVEVEDNLLLSDNGGEFVIREGSSPITGQPFTDSEAAAFFTGSTFDNTLYDLDTQTEVNMTTGKLQSGGLTHLGTYGAEVAT